ncbi:hypothetical protein RRG08_002332 [Elysia crispata]|uniref:Uncharacterized protein n=1 Tax=Elysia crispata TaxID=231223 RepID=A0AAE0ZBB7_9GAST|nr:hypothetical protein RRG08_002332 [Elysia crispata]
MSCSYSNLPINFSEANEDSNRNSNHQISNLTRSSDHSSIELVPSMPTLLLLIMIKNALLFFGRYRYGFSMLQASSTFKPYQAQICNARDRSLLETRFCSVDPGEDAHGLPSSKAD